METHLDNMVVSSHSNPVHGSTGHEEPQGDLELAVAELWRDLFNMDKIGRNDNFFELGGNSLLGMDLSEMLATRLAIEVPALAIFQHPTIAAITRFIESE
jgi:Phosphopantetheine attachment site